jgi:squalene-associated FAD-dependent desaturase
MKRVAIVGGGWAGLAAGVALADAGLNVTLFEGSKSLGGRARRIDVDGRPLDNGLHILIGAYRETLALMQRVAPGAATVRRLPLTLEIAGRFRLACPRLPAPLHLLAGLATARGLDLGDRLAAARFMLGQRLGGFRARSGETVAGLLERLRQPSRNREFLWQPLCIAALNTPPETADAQVFLNVVRDGLDGPGGASDLVLPAADLGTLFPEPAAAFITSRGGAVRTGCAVKGIQRESAAFVLQSAAGAETFTHVVCATDPARGAALLGGLPELAALAGTLGELRFLPIVSVYLQYAPAFRMHTPMLGFGDGPAQWAFDRGTLCGQAGLIGAVASAATDIDRTPGDALATAVDAQLRRSFPDLPPPLWHRVITERRATFACVPGMPRPPQKTDVPRFHLAGDYTRSDYPATLEAAVRSGLACARAIQEDP